MKLDYASAIINLRIKLNLSQSALAELLGVSFTSVNRWENGKYEPTKLVKRKLNYFVEKIIFKWRLRNNYGKGG